MFACAPYPEDDPNFVNEVRSEVRYQVKRLRNHPSLVLWRGNLKNRVRVDESPAVVDTRQRLDDWEVDMIIGKGHRFAIVSLTDRILL